MQVVDTIVVGAGLAGMVFTWQYLHDPRNQDKKICVLEKSPFGIGGRIHSLELPHSSRFIELGPARFNNTHTQLRQLLCDLQIDTYDYKDSHICTFRGPFSDPLLNRDPDSRKKQITRSYPTLSAVDFKILSTYEYDPLRLLLDTLDKQSMISTDTNLESFVSRFMSPTLTQVVKDATGFESSWSIQMPEAALVIQDMFSPQRKWYGTKEPLESIPNKMMSILVHKFSTQLCLRIGSTVEKIERQETKFCIQLNSGDCSFECNKCILALDLPQLKTLLSHCTSWVNPQLLSLLNNAFAPFLLLRMYMQFPIDPLSHKSWYNQEKFPVLYTATKLRMVIPSSIPGIMQVSYTDMKYSSFWLNLLKEEGQQVRPDLWTVTSPESKIIRLILSELLWLFPGAHIPNPTILWGHPCHVMYPTGKEYASLPALLRPDPDIAIIGEATAISSDLGITSSWMESAIRSGVKGYHHIMARSEIRAVQL